MLKNEKYAQVLKRKKYRKGKSRERAQDNTQDNIIIYLQLSVVTHLLAQLGISVEDEVKQVEEGLSLKGMQKKKKQQRGMDKRQDGRDADLICFGFQGVCGTGTPRTLALLCGNTYTHTHDTHKDINSWVEKRNE